MEKKRGRTDRENNEEGEREGSKGQSERRGCKRQEETIERKRHEGEILWCGRVKD